MLDGIFELLSELGAAIDAIPLSSLLLVLFLALVLGPLSTLVHELGHAAVARFHGIPVKEVVVEPEGSIVWRRGGTVFRIGLGLTRDHRSSEPVGWVKLGGFVGDSRHLRNALVAGPLAEALFGVLLLATATGFGELHFSLRLVLALAAIECVFSAVYSLVANGDGGTDGALLRRLRDLEARPPQAHRDPNEATTVAPPNHRG